MLHYRQHVMCAGRISSETRLIDVTPPPVADGALVNRCGAVGWFARCKCQGLHEAGDAQRIEELLPAPQHDHASVDPGRGNESPHARCAREIDHKIRWGSGRFDIDGKSTRDKDNLPVVCVDTSDSETKRRNRQNEIGRISVKVVQWRKRFTQSLPVVDPDVCHFTLHDHAMCALSLILPRTGPPSVWLRTAAARLPMPPAGTTTWR